MTAAEAGFLLLSQCGDRPELYGDPLRFDTTTVRVLATLREMPSTCGRRSHWIVRGVAEGGALHEACCRIADDGAGPDGVGVLRAATTEKETYQEIAKHLEEAQRALSPPVAAYRLRRGRHAAEHRDADAPPPPPPAGVETAIKSVEALTTYLRGNPNVQLKGFKVKGSRPVSTLTSRYHRSRRQCHQGIKGVEARHCAALRGCRSSIRTVHRQHRGGGRQRRGLWKVAGLQSGKLLLALKAAASTSLALSAARTTNSRPDPEHQTTGQGIARRVLDTVW